VIGNRDLNYKWLEVEYFEQRKGWRIDEFFWSHTMTIDGKELAFVHIDTNFLAYGKKGEAGNK